LVKEAVNTEAFENEITTSIDRAIAYSEQINSGEKSATISDCTNITVRPIIGSFPKTVTINFGDGCEEVKGFIRSGSMSITISDTLRTTGTSYDVTFNNFAVEEYSITGTVSVENTSSGEVLSFSQKMDLTMTDVDGIVIEKSKTVERVWIEGSETSDITDDVFSISGYADISSTSGRAYSYSITEPLIVSYSCDIVSEGVMEITTSASDEPVIIDFGNDGCDWKIYVSQGNIEKEEINLNN
jgi:hypothetical protein